MRLWQRNRLKRINILEGSVSSGKTWISLVLWAFWIKTMPNDPDRLYLMCARSLTTLKRNCLLLLQSLIGEANFQFSLSTKEGWLFNRHILLEGANDAQAETKIRGVTLQGAYCDELTKLPKDFFTMLLSRLRLSGAKLIATTNPDTPNHWLKTNYIDRQDELDLLDVLFTIEDNTTLPYDYIENIKKEYTGVFYERFILGKWTVAEGAIYDMFDTSRHVFSGDGDTYGKYYVSCDYGTQNATVFLLWRKSTDGKWKLLREYYYSGRTSLKQKTDREYAEDLVRWLDGIKPELIIVDPSAASFIAELKQHKFRIKGAVNDVLDGIRYVASLLNREQIMISDTCVNTLKEFGSYIWDTKAADRGEDKPVKQSDHAMDALRYFCNTVIRNPAGTLGNTGMKKQSYWRR